MVNSMEARQSSLFWFDIYHFPAKPLLRMEANDYDFINILHTHLICHFEPLQQGYKLLLEVGLLEQEKHTGTSFLHTLVRKKKAMKKEGDGGEELSRLNLHDSWAQAYHVSQQLCHWITHS